MIVDPWFYVAASVAVLVVGLAKGGLGGGIGVIAVPLMAMVISPVQAAAILLPILMVMDALAMYAYWRLWDARYLRVLVPAALVGTVLGFLTARSISVDGLRILVAGVALAYAAVDVRRRARSAGPPNPAAAALCNQVHDTFEIVRLQRRPPVPPGRRRLHQPPHPGYGPGEPCRLDGFQQVVDGVHLERLYRMPIVRGHENHPGSIFPIQQLPRHFETGPAGHLDVEQHEVGVQGVDDLQGLQAVSRLPDDLHVIELLELEAELVAGEPLVVDHHGTYAHVRPMRCAARSASESRCARTFPRPACSPAATGSSLRI